MKEIRQLLFSEIKDDSIYRTYTGAGISDPRIYYHWTPQKVAVTDAKPGYGVFYRSGAIHSDNRVDIGGRDDQIFVVELYGKSGGLVEDMADRLVDLFRDQQYTTDNYSVLRTWATVIGGATFHEDRKLFTLSVNIYFTKILAR